MARTIPVAACIAFLLLCAGLQAERRAEPADPVSVVVVGLAPLGEDADLARAHAEALIDARRNALLQACVLVETERRVEGMRLSEGHDRMRTDGRVESLSVLEAGPVRNARPTFYRVRARAVVQPLPPDGQRLPGAGERWQPIVALERPAELPSDGVREGLSKLIGSLRACGIAVQERERSGAALQLALDVTSRQGTDGRSLAISWRLETGTPRAEEQGSAPTIFAGESRHSGDAAPSVTWWERQGVAIAQDALRLWAVPRQTSIRLRTRSEAAAERLRRAFGNEPGADVRAEVAGGDTTIIVNLTVAGNPVPVVAAVLERAGLADRFAPAEIALDGLAFHEIEGTREARGGAEE